MKDQVFTKYVITRQYKLYELGKINVNTLIALYYPVGKEGHPIKRGEDDIVNHVDLEYFNDKSQIMNLIKKHWSDLK